MPGKTQTRLRKLRTALAAVAAITHPGFRTHLRNSLRNADRSEALILRLKKSGTVSAREATKALTLVKRLRKVASGINPAIGATMKSTVVDLRREIAALERRN